MAVVQCPCPCPSESDCMLSLKHIITHQNCSFCVVYVLALGFIHASKSVGAFALVSLGARTETFNESAVCLRLCISSNGISTDEQQG